MSTRLDWEDVVEVAKEAAKECVGANIGTKCRYTERLREMLDEIDGKVGKVV